MTRQVTIVTYAMFQGNSEVAKAIQDAQFKVSECPSSPACPQPC